MVKGYLRTFLIINKSVRIELGGLCFLAGVVLFQIAHKFLHVLFGATKNHVKNGALKTGILLMHY
ncbi:hypothetical protein ABEZ86_00045 [Micromonospora provocatoris]